MKILFVEKGEYYYLGNVKIRFEVIVKIRFFFVDIKVGNKMFIFKTRWN